MMDEAEAFFKKQETLAAYHSPEEEMRRLTDLYRRTIFQRPQLDCSAWAELVIWELHQMQRHEARPWSRRGRRERRLLKMALTWLRRCGVSDIDYEAVMPLYWEDIAVLLYLDGNWGIRRLFPSLTLAVLGDRGSEYDAPVRKTWDKARPPTEADYNLGEEENRNNRRNWVNYILRRLRDEQKKGLI